MFDVFPDSNGIFQQDNCPESYYSWLKSMIVNSLDVLVTKIAWSKPDEIHVGLQKSRP